MTAADRALLTRVQARCTMADAWVIEQIIAERDALRLALAAATDAENVQRRITGRLADWLQAETGIRTYFMVVKAKTEL